MKMKKHNLLIWKAQDKFDNPSRAIYGERLVIEVSKPKNRKNRRLRLTRQFRNYFEWYDMTENGRLDITLTKSLLDELKRILEEAWRDVHGDA